MRHGYFGKKLSRTHNERMQLRRILVRNFVRNGKLKTTRAKAKAIQPLVEKLITRAKKDGEKAKKLLLKELADKKTVKELLAYARQSLTDRQGGYTRLVKLGQRVGDASEEVLLQFVDPKKDNSGELKEKEKTNKPKQPKTQKVKSKTED